jgi:hypothetical protein
MTTTTTMKLFGLALIVISSANHGVTAAFVARPVVTTAASRGTTGVGDRSRGVVRTSNNARGNGAAAAASTTTTLSAAAEGSMVNPVTGEQLEMMMQEWEQPLVVDAYATVSNCILCRT